MAADFFLKLDGIDGESKDKVDPSHEKEIDIYSFSFGLTQTGTGGVGGGSGGGKVSFMDISISKKVDKSSEALKLCCANGKHIATGTITCRKAGEKPVEYYKIDLKEILITSVSLSGGGGGEEIMEQVSLNFADITCKYKEQLAEGGSGAEPGFHWDVKGNTGEMV